MVQYHTLMHISLCFHMLHGLCVCNFCTAVRGPVNEGNLRLVGGASQYEGRVEVLHNGEWGTVCNDDWDITDANVACRQLGYGRALFASATFGGGSGTILYDDVFCKGTELRLVDCPNSGTGVHDCTHADDAGVVCYNIAGQLGSVHTVFSHVYVQSEFQNCS